MKEATKLLEVEKNDKFQSQFSVGSLNIIYGHGKRFETEIQTGCFCLNLCFVGLEESSVQEVYLLDWDESTHTYEMSKASGERCCWSAATSTAVLTALSLHSMQIWLVWSRLCQQSRAARPWSTFCFRCNHAFFIRELFSGFFFFMQMNPTIISQVQEI